MRIDAHQHFWQYDPQKHSWIEDHMAILRKDYLPADLWPLLQANDLDGTVAVQADQSAQETTFLLDLAAQNDFIKGVVGWIDLRADDLDSSLKQYEGYSVLKGFRHVVQDEPKGFMLDPKFIAGVSKLAGYDYSYDILIFHYQLEEAVAFVDQLPEMRLVIDHCAKPDILNLEFDNWYKHLAQLAQHKHVWIKVSGLVTEADWNSWTPEQIKPYINAVIELFGVDRVMFGSDWPVCTLAGAYDQIVSLVREGLGYLSTEDLQKLFGKNATAFYHL